MNNDKITIEAEMTNIMVEPTTTTSSRSSTPTDPTRYPNEGVNLHSQEDSQITSISTQSLDPKEETHETDQHETTKREESQEWTNHSMSTFSPPIRTQQDQYPLPTTTETISEEMAPPYNEDDAIQDDAIQDDEDMEQLVSEDIHTIHSCDSETQASIRSGTGVGIMNDKMSELMRTWSHDDNGVIKKDATTDDDKKIPNFQPGDHVIRWKMIKVMLYPIQIHGIVLSVEKDASGTKVVIADFGMSSSQARKKNGLETMNKTMNNAVYETTKAMNNLFGVGAPKKSNRCDDSEMDRELEASMKNIKSSTDDDDDRRFHIRTITSPDDLRKWSKVNYGQSLFSSKGKLDKLKKIFTFPQKKDDDANASNATTMDDVSSSFFDEDDDFFKVSDGNLEPVSETTHGSDNEKNATSELTESNHNDGGTNRKTTPTTFSKSPTKAPSRSRKNDRIPASVAITTTHNADNLTNSDIKTLEQMIAEANDIDRKQRSRRIFRGKAKQSFDEMSTSSTTSSMSLSSHFSNLRPSLSINRIKGEAGNIMKKLSFSRPKTPVDNDDTKADEDGENGPKLPKSDHRSIVLARVRFILAEQEKKETESCLPPYHIFYSNSECIAVWCKTGKFCTLQAAVFLHSTAICNVKSTVMLTAGVAATQPWLIPVVGVYGIVAIGMPYMILNKCQKKWKNSEQALTDGFWAEADNEVIVTAIEQWSDLCPEKRVNTDEVGMN